VTRWTRRLLIGAIAILVPALAGCQAGLNAPTLQYHPASSGVSTTVNGIELDNVFVLGPQLNQTLPAGGQAGVFLAISSLNHDRLVSASAPGAASSVQLLNGPVPIIPGATVYLTGPAPLIVLNGLTSPLSGGETVHLVLTFANAGVVPLEVPVQPAAYEYATFSPPPIPTPSASTAAIVKHRHKARAGASATAAP
jgi:copper(I)-binding protein